MAYILLSIAGLMWFVMSTNNDFKLDWVSIRDSSRSICALLEQLDGNCPN